MAEGEVVLIDWAHPPFAGAPRAAKNVTPGVSPQTLSTDECPWGFGSRCYFRATPHVHLHAGKRREPTVYRLNDWADARRLLAGEMPEHL